MSDLDRTFLRRLRDANRRGIPQSSIPSTRLPLIHSLLACGAIEYESGSRGVIVRICDPAAFDRVVTSRYPTGLDVDMQAIQSRSAAVAMLGDAKAIRRGACQGIFVRSCKPGIVVGSTDGQVLPVSNLTASAGGAAILLSNTRQWTFGGNIVIVENEEAFWNHERVLPEVDLAVYASGKMSERLLAWLASPLMLQCSIIHWGDYDPAGLREYRRLAVACPGRVRFFVPDNLAALLASHGKRDLILKQIEHLDRLRGDLSDPVIRMMVELFDQHRRGLEQEILLYLNRTST